MKIIIENYKELERTCLKLQAENERLSKEISGYKMYIDSLEKDLSNAENKVKAYEEIITKALIGGKK